jgi:hypothetical protein
VLRGSNYGVEENTSDIGSTGVPAAPGSMVIATTDLCIVQQMRVVCDEYVALKVTIAAVAGDSNTSDKLDALLQNGILIPAAFAVMNKAVGYYATGIVPKNRLCHLLVLRAHCPGIY